MAGYVVADVEVLDAEAFRQYQAQTPATVRQYGGEFVLLGGAAEAVEGDWRPHRLVVIRFESVAAARAWYQSPEYQAVLPIRLRSARSSVVIVEGS
jgi:uncharacterized protein (DUF1330 family)